MAKIEEKVEEIVTPIINNLGYEIYDVIYTKEGKDNYLRIFIDNDQPITLDDCEKVNDGITEILDETNIIKEQYFLEISSPGVERHIRKEKHYQQSIGKEINVKVFKPINKKKEIAGILKSIDKQNIIIQQENLEEVKLEIDNISSAKRIFKW